MINHLRIILKTYGVLYGLMLFIKSLASSSVKIGGAHALRLLLGIKKIIVFKGQTDFYGNSRVLYDYMIEHGYDKKYTLVWHIDDISSIDAFDSSQCTVISSRNRIKSIYYNACSMIVFYDTDCCFRRKVKGQKIVYLGHACPLIKNCKGFITLREKTDTSAIITTENVRELFAEMFQFPTTKFIINGLPRNDLIVGSHNKFNDFDKSLTKSVIIWMPTFRKSKVYIDGKQRIDSNTDYLYGLPLIHSSVDLENINSVLEKCNMQLVIKTHPGAAESHIEQIDYKNIRVWTDGYLRSNDINIYSFFGDSIGLISDYSSVSFDYMFVDKPLGYIVDDINDYKLGFAYNNILDYMPGEHISSLSELYNFFSNIAMGNDLYAKKRRSVHLWSNDYRDGRNTERLVKIFDL